MEYKQQEFQGNCITNEWRNYTEGEGVVGESTNLSDFGKQPLTIYYKANNKKTWNCTQILYLSW